MTVQVRQATVEDIASLVALRQPDTEAGPADARMARYLRGQHHPRDARADRIVVLAEHGHEAVGYAAGHRTVRYGCEGEVQYLYVAPAHRRAGVATALLAALASWFSERSIERVCVDVVPENARARAFYTRLGAVALNPNWMVWNDLPASMRPEG